MFPTRAMTILGGDSFRDEYSIRFDGTNDYIDCGTGVDLGTGDWSMAFWVKCDEADWGQAHRYFISKHQNADNRWYVRLKNDDPPRIQLYGKTGGDDLENTIYGDSAVPPSWDDLQGQWVHVCLSCDRDDKFKAYFNGILNKSVNADAEDMDNTGPIHLARWDSVYEDIILSDFVMYDKALSESEVKTIYNGREPYNHKEGIASNNLTRWWRFGDDNRVGHEFGLIANQATSYTTSTIYSSDFSSGVDSWLDYGSGTKSHSTTISAHDGSSGVLKTENDATNTWLARRAISGTTSGRHYMLTGYVYIPTAWSGSSNIYAHGSNSFGTETVGLIDWADVSIKDSWQKVVWTMEAKATSGYLYLRVDGSGSLEDGDFVYWSGFKLEEINNAGMGLYANANKNGFFGQSVLQRGAY